MNTPRAIDLEEMEKYIQGLAIKKDTTFILSGPWKTFVHTTDGLDVYRVDVDWIHANLSVIFGHGGHGLVHEFIPVNEIWIADKHPSGLSDACECTGVVDRIISDRYAKSTEIHEITELKLMHTGMKYSDAHQHALNVERKLGYLCDPFEENYTSL